MLSQVLSQLRLDVTTVVSSVLGRGPSPFVQRRPRRAARVAHTPSLGRPLQVDEVIRETEDTVSLVLSDPAGPLQFTPGQFFTLIVTVGGERLRRAYSASSEPGALGGRVRLTVRRQPEGRVSTHLVAHARAGDTLTALGPSGGFVPAAYAFPPHVLLVGGGSGITPLLSIARHLLACEPAKRVTIVFGNRRERDIPFRAELLALVAAHPGRLVVRHVLSEPEERWTEGVGMLTRDVLDRELDGLADALGGASADDTAAFLCGPEPMMRAARAALRGRGLTDDQIREEAFTSPASAGVAPKGPVELTFRVDGQSVRAVQAVGKTLLEAGLEAGLDLPYSCAMGGCGACKLHLISGETTREGLALTPAERRAGLVLACSDRALGPCTLERPR